MNEATSEFFASANGGTARLGAFRYSPREPGFRRSRNEVVDG